MTLLPTNSTQFELAAEEALSEREFIKPALIEIRGIKYARPLNASIAPWLVQEYGLGPISQFFDTFEELIDQGRYWQKIRGTPMAVETALGWIDYGDITILDHMPTRRRWHLYQINMGELPLPDEDQRLADAEFLAGLSDSSRNYFWRGFYGYDVRVHIWGRSQWGRSIWGTSSGVRINDGKTYWSHGRSHEVEIIPTPAELDEFGVDYHDGDELTWQDELAWDTPGITWQGVETASDVIAWALSSMDVYLGLYGGGDALLGYVKCLTPTEQVDASLHYDIRTGFGDGAGMDIESVSLIFGGQNAGTVKPFKRFLAPNQVVFPVEHIRVGSFDLPIELKKTIREFFAVSLLIEE